MPRYPAFNGENNKQAWGGDREIDRHAVLIAQAKEAHFTGSLLYAHLCLWNCNRLFQLHALLDRGVVTTDAPPAVNVWKKKKNIIWVVSGVKTYFLDYFFPSFLSSQCCLKHFSNAASSSHPDSKNKKTTHYRAFCLHSADRRMDASSDLKEGIIDRRNVSKQVPLWWPRFHPPTSPWWRNHSVIWQAVEVGSLRIQVQILAD